MILALIAAAAAQPPGETPRAFMERIYAGYRNADYSPFSHPERVFSPRLIEAVNEDSRLSHGEVGYIDGDPVCQCQDAGGMRATVLGVKLQGANQALATVSLRFDDAARPRPVTFKLVRGRSGWRIADVSSADEPSFLRAVEKANREA